MSITVEQVIATLEEVVAEKGEDYVYPGAIWAAFIQMVSVDRLALWVML